MEHCGGDEHDTKYVHSTLLFLLLLLSLEFLSTHSRCFIFLRFHDFIFGFCPPRHRHPPTVFVAAGAFNADISKWNTAAVTNMATAFYAAWAFNADISKWNTAAVTNMYGSRSTPPSCFCCCFFHLNSVHSLPLLFFSSLFQFFPTVSALEHCAAVPGIL